MTYILFTYNQLLRESAFFISMNNYQKDECSIYISKLLKLRIIEAQDGV